MGEEARSLAPHLLSIIPLVLVFRVHHEAHHLEETLGSEQ